MNAVVSPRGGHQRSPEPKTKTVVDFGGVNLRGNRQSLRDSEFWWLENIQPIGPGNLHVVASVSTTLQTIVSQSPVSVWPANISSVDYDFVVMSSGHIYQVRKTSPFTATQITSVSGAIFTSGQTALAVWNNTIVLIIDPSAGYWYWTGSSLVAISNTLATITIIDPGVYAGSPPTVSFSGGGGSGAAADVYMGIITAKVNVGGTGYTVGDVLTVSAGGFTIAGNHPEVKVATITGAGVVATVTIENSGTILGAVGVSALTTTGGTGSGATFDVSFGVSGISISSVGSGYTSAPSVVFSNPAGKTRDASATATASGALNGTSIATYAGRAWIGSGRSVSFTDVESYTSFAGAGGAFTIDDETLHGNITSLFAANSFLYIEGDSSFDILGDVQVSSGITSFTRQNVTASVGTTLPNSIFPFYRSLYFANPSGFYSLSGSTPQKLSDNLDGLIPFIDFTKPVTGGQVMVKNVLCAAFCFQFNDVFTFIGGSRPLLAVLNGSEWFFINPGSQAKFVSSCPIAGVETMFVWNFDGANAYLTQLQGGTANVGAVVMTRLWDCEAPLFDKQLVRTGFGVNWNNQDATSSAIRVNGDNESSTTTYQTVTSGQMGSGYTYTFFVSGSANVGGGKYVGLTFAITARQISLALMAIEYIEGAIF